MKVAAQLSTAVESFGSDPAHFGNLMRELLDANRSDFAEASLDLLGRFEDNHGYLYLLNLLATGDLLLPLLLDLSRSGNPALPNVVRVSQRVYPLLRAKLAAKLAFAPANPDPDQEEQLLHFLALIEVSSSGTQLFILKRLQTSDNPRIRSRVASMLRHYAHSSSWFADALTDPDHRVRANAVESLWGVEMPEAPELFRLARTDPNGRVAANALVGLYLAGQVDALEGIEALSKDADALRRASAAWAMGRTGDRRFLGHVRNLLQDPHSSVRANAVRAATRLRQPASPAALVGLTIFHPEPDAIPFSLELPVRMSLPEVPPLAVHFHLNGRPVLRYSIEERTAPGSMALVFLVPNEPTLRGPWTSGFRAATAKSRADDLWTVLPYSPRPPEEVDWAGILLKANEETAGEGPMQPEATQAKWVRDARTSVERFYNQNVLAARPPGLFDMAIHACDRLATVGLHRNLIFLCPEELSDAGEPQSLETLLDFAKRDGIVIHAIAAGRSAGETARVITACRQSGGLAFASAPPNAPDLLCRAIYRHFVLRCSLPEQGGPARLQLNLPTLSAEKVFEICPAAPTPSTQ